LVSTAILTSQRPSGPPFSRPSTNSPSADPSTGRTLS